MVYGFIDDLTWLEYMYYPWSLAHIEWRHRLAYSHNILSVKQRSSDDVIGSFTEWSTRSVQQNSPHKVRWCPALLPLGYRSHCGFNSLVPSSATVISIVIARYVRFDPVISFDLIIVWPTGGVWKHTVFVHIHSNDGRLFSPALCDCSSQTYFIA